MAGKGASSVVSVMLEQSQPLLDAFPRAIVVVDGVGTIVAWNNFSEKLYGWGADEAIGQSLYQLIIPPHLRRAGRQIMASVLEGNAWTGNIKVLRRTGEILEIRSFLGPLCDARGHVVGAIGAAEDTEETLRLRQETSDLADRVRLALSAGQLGTWQWDQASGVTTWDATMEGLFGLEPGTFGGTFDDYVALLHPEEVDHILSVVERAVAEKTSYDVEHRVVMADGSVRWLQGRGEVTTDADGNVTGTIGCSGDVTERKLAEANASRRLREAEQAANKERLQRERLEFISSLNDVALAASDHLELMTGAASAAVPRLGDWCLLHYFPEPGVHEQRVAHADPERIEWAGRLQEQYPYYPNGLFGVHEVMRTGETEFFSDLDDTMLERAFAHPRDPGSDESRAVIDELQLTSLITVPLLTKRGVVGAMQFVSAESKRHYDNEDVTLAEAAAGRLAEALDNAWLLDQQRRISTTLQAALLPGELPDIPGVTIAVRYWAAGAVSEVGGDFYDVFPIAENRWALVIGDVCGTGPAAAAVTAIARHTIRAAATHGVDHATVLNWVNEAILASGNGLFCTLLYSTLDHLPDGSWRYTSVAGGHPLPILVDHGTWASKIGTYGTLIGVLPAISVTVTETVLAKGSTLVLHTDGVNDVRPPHDLDDEALAELVMSAARSAGPADEIAARLGAAIERILPIPDRNDDVALVVVRVD